MAKDNPPVLDPSALPFELPEKKEADEKRELPKDIYYQRHNLYEGATEQSLEELVQSMLAADVYESLQLLAVGRGVAPLTMLRQGLHYAFESGGFDCAQAEAGEDPKDVKRTGNDENAKATENIRIRAVIGETNFNILVAHARPNKLSNLAALNRGIKHALRAGEI